MPYCAGIIFYANDNTTKESAVNNKKGNIPVEYYLCNFLIDDLIYSVESLYFVML